MQCCRVIQPLIGNDGILVLLIGSESTTLVTVTGTPFGCDCAFLAFCEQRDCVQHTKYQANTILRAAIAREAFLRKSSWQCRGIT